VADQAGSAEERHATWLELFFDLTVVAAAAQISHRMTVRARKRQEEQDRRQARKLARLIQRGISPDRLEAPKTTYLSVAQVERGHLDERLGLFAAIVALATGFGALIPQAAEHLHTMDRRFLFGGLALYFATSLFAGMAGRAPLKWFLGWSLPCLLVAVAAAVFGHPLPAWSLAVLASVILGWFSTYDRLVERARRTELATV
jgi:low temperature requirement protein LtrA